MSKARKIEDDLAISGLDLVRDERALRFTEDLHSYMKTIRTTDYALILVSDAFLKSANCMYEVLEFLKDENHQQRVLPVIIKDYEDGGIERRGAKIYSPENAADYVRYWQDRETVIREKLAGVDISNLTHFSRELALAQGITKSVADFIFLLRRIKHISFDDLVAHEYRELLQKIGFGRDIGTGHMRRARSLYSQAIAEVDVERRLSFLTKALEIYPCFVDALNKRGQIFDELKQYDHALADYNKALSITPDRAALYISRSYALIRKEQYVNALEDLGKALSLEPNHKEAFNNRADIYRRLGRFAEAVRDARRALEIDGEFDLAYATLAETAAAMNQTETFFDHLSKAVELGFPLHKYAFDPIYNDFRGDSRFGTLLELSRQRNRRFI